MWVTIQFSGTAENEYRLRSRSEQAYTFKMGVARHVVPIHADAALHNLPHEQTEDIVAELYNASYSCER